MYYLMSILKNQMLEICLVQAKFHKQGLSQESFFSNSNLSFDAN